MTIVLDELIKTENGVETADALVSVLSYIVDVASEEDRAMLRAPVGFTLNAIRQQLQDAREGCQVLYRRHAVERASA